MSDLEVKIEEFVVQNDAILQSGKVGVAFSRVSDTKHTRLVLNKDKTTRRLHVGQVYEIPTTNDGNSFLTGRIRWLRQFEDKVKVAEWQAAQRADDIRLAAVALEKKMSSSSSVIEELVEPLRKAYQDVPYPNRLAFEMYVLSVMRRKS